jgi:hypothetical protein
MAITNAQQYKQLLAKGGRIGFQGGGADLGTVSTSSRKARDDRAISSRAAATQKAASVARSAAQQDDDYQSAAYDTKKIKSPPRGGGQDLGEVKELPPVRETYETEAFDVTDPQSPFNTLQTLYDTGVGDSGLPGVTGAAVDFFQPVRDRTLRKNIDFYRVDPRARKARAKYGLTADGYKKYMQERLAGRIDAAGNTIYSDDDDDQPIIPIIPQDPMTMDQATDELVEEDDSLNTAREKGILARRFRADGGIMNDDIIGGMMDGNMDEMGRQMYGLGKLVKKATRAVKKIVKSPIGKAALLYTGAGALGNLAGGSGLAGMFKGFTSPSTFLSRSKLGGIFSKDGLRNILVGGKDYFGERARDYTPFSGLLGKGGEFTFGKVATLASLLPFFGLGTGDESEEEAKKILDNSGISPEEFDRLRNDIDYQNSVLSRRSRAGGGIMRLGYQEGGDAEPVAKKTMPLLDMDGMEKDYRETGGFVEMGRMERADDVPARLSKNEFVFTADAVRNAGDGDIDKGAEVMYNMMKNLEDGGDVSEESQGLEGARKMFQTSQRLEEVL